jgi:hypothetical protein
VLSSARESVPRAVASVVSTIGSMRELRSLPLAVLIRQMRELRSLPLAVLIRQMRELRSLPLAVLIHQRSPRHPGNRKAPIRDE